MIMEETRWGVVSPGSGWSISTFRADFVHFTSKSGLAHFRCLSPTADRGKRLIGLWSNLLLSFSTESEQDP
jgi:hypothetical protein